ncbi:TIGR04282 family arsenosugar biosynthesis glycosyltransferase [Aquimarina agarilytica]|uniref:TIGR04282 family arsenosugar biosynthesis glycosyltransferase n=1 Tax=Aquimarina agarilytica TaxID=1087449 RepID=UPI000288087E|nr:TIGR04282 family arsenosugar biosynthesis glycosyltransferase [Aquimarina agarilytica]
MHTPKTKNLLLIFTRNPELGKVKSRLAADIGQQNALDIYIFLVNYTQKVTQQLNVDKQVWYSESLGKNDMWDSNDYSKKLQPNTPDLGERMEYAFNEGFKNGYQHIIIIGSDLYDITQQDIEVAFDKLQQNNAVIGPATDGGFYLLGLSQPIPSIFKNKNWGTNTVLNDTLNNLKSYSFEQLTPKNDVDYLDDIKEVAAFKPFIKYVTND